jgi:LPXTG-motif cell wall-anchored protein
LTRGGEIGSIVGATVGFLTLMGAISVFWWKRHKKKPKTGAETDEVHEQKTSPAPPTTTILAVIGLPRHKEPVTT